MAKLLRVRQIQYTFPSNMLSVDITVNPGYDPQSTIVTRSFKRTDNDNDSDNIMIRKVDSNTIRIESRTAINSGSVVSLQLMEFESGVLVQDLVAGRGAYDINPVDLSKSMIFYSGNIGNDNALSEQVATCRFLNDTQVYIDYAKGTEDCSFQVVEWDGASVAQYALAGTGSQSGLTQIDVGINDVVPERALAFAHMTTPNSEAVGAVVLNGEFVVDLDGIARTVRFVRNLTGDLSGMQATVFVVEFNDGTVCERQDETANSGNINAIFSYPTFDGEETPADKLAWIHASSLGEVAARSNFTNPDEHDAVMGFVTMPTTEGSDIIVERDASTQDVIYGLWFLRPNYQDTPEATEAYPGLTEDRINEILAETLYTEPWDLADDPLRYKALKAAGVAIDQLNYMGELTDDSQTNQFPRNGDEEVPYDVHSAIVNEAIMLLDGMDPQMEHENISIKSQGYANVRNSSDHSATQDHMLAGIMSILAWRRLVPYLRDTRDINLLRGS